MELIALLVVWTIITLIGHGTWVLIRGFFRLISDTGPPTDRLPPVNEKADLAAARRVINRMVVRGLIDESAAREMRAQLRHLELQQTTATIYPAPGPLDRVDQAAGSAGRQPPLPSDDQPLVAKLAPDVIPPEQPSQLTKPAPAPHAASPSQRVLAQERDSRGIQDDSVDTTAPLLSRSQVIQSFLAAHNIRWGELAAGMLIVSCSIGLVISLWSPLVETHRVIPSLIFLGANAAIYAAGLYTLSRWRLRHTSRAVLVIATLLVPLSVLAGLAAAGTTADAVQLGDPITLGAIALASLVYIGLLYRGGKALSGTWLAGPIALSVAGPVAILPLVPATLRVIDIRAGWIIGIGSTAILMALMQVYRIRRRTEGTIGVAGGRARIQVMAFGGFSLAVAIGYCGFALRHGGLVAMLPIAIASIPALAALAASARSLMRSARRNTQSLTGAVLTAALIGMIWAILPPSLTSASWLWSWGLVFWISAAVVGWQFRQPGWLALSTLPLGMAATFSAPLWIGGQPWPSIAMWQRIVGGEPMIAASLATVLVAVATLLTKDDQRKKWMGLATAFWGGVSVMIAAGLAVSPSVTLGVAPWWSVSIVLTTAALACVALAMSYRGSAFAVIGTTVFAWLSVFQPIRWSIPLAGPPVWMGTSIAIAITMLTLVELMPGLSLRLGRFHRVTLVSARIWARAADVAAIFAAALACVFASQDWQASSWTLAASAALLLWSSTTSRSVDLLRFSQIATVAFAVVIGYGRLDRWLFEPAAWSGATALWAWACVSGSVAGTWVGLRWVAASNLPRSVQRRVRHLMSHRALPSRTVDGWMAATATALLSLGSIWAMAAILVAVGGEPIIVYDARFWLPLIAILIGVTVVWTIRRWESDRSISDNLLATVMLAGLVWIACHVAHTVSADAAAKLVLATTTATATSLLFSRWVLPRIDAPLAQATVWLFVAVAASLTTISSTVLLVDRWLDPIVAGTYAEKLPTISVAAWWIVAAATLLWESRRTLQPTPSSISAVLGPAAAAILVPVFTLSHPVVWVQVAGIASVAWIALSQWWLRGDAERSARPAINGSNVSALLIGIVTSLLVTVSIMLDIGTLRPVMGPTGLAISLLAVGAWSVGWFRPHRDAVHGRADESTRLPWPIAISLLSGQLAWLSGLAGFSAAQQVELIAGIWVAASLASLLQYRSSQRLADLVHVALLSIVTTAMTWVVGGPSERMTLLALAQLTIGGLLVPFVGAGTRRTGGSRLPTTAGTPLSWEAFRLLTSRLLGWWVICAGGAILVTRVATGPNPWVSWTLLVTWSAIWVVLWRLICVDGATEDQDRRRIALAIPDMEFASLLMVAVIGETIFFTLSGRSTFQSTVLGDPLLWGRVGAYAVAGLSAPARAARRVVWSIAVATLVAAVGLVSVEVSIHVDATTHQRLVWATLPCGFTIAFIAHWLPALAALSRRVTKESAAIHFGRLVQATWQVASVVACAGGVCAAWMIIDGAPPPDTNLTIITVALAAWAVAEIAQASDSGRLRHAAVRVALIAIGLWASVDSGETMHPLLTASMRWLVASVFTIPMLLFVFPRLLGPALAASWREAFRSGAMLASGVAGCSLASMLVMEATVRTETGIVGISRTLVIGVAVTLAALSALAGLVAIASGPVADGSRRSWRERLALSDQQRVWLVIAAQTIGGVTWLHVFLCEAQWAFVGLRPYWPYTVMALAFVSVGVTEWARRRGDLVLSRTLAHTALYLPLLPVIGFWLSGEQLDWVFRGGRVRYDLLLAIGSVYYIAVASLWKGVLPRVAAILLGNAAWWVVLVQQPGWGFLFHPQVWLIPPAACVLAVVHFYRDRLEPAVASGIRYASTLVIYISSTADMLLQQIGTNLWGPIVLVLLALAGMAAGVVLRVRPFLYLGALFVFLGVTSMVWHAHLAIDAVWPWWVFGITAGIGLLAGLMALEKNKPKLRRYADQLATWQG